MGLSLLISHSCHLCGVCPMFSALIVLFHCFFSLLIFPCEFELLLNHNFCLPSVARSAWKVGLDAMQNFGSRSWNVQGSRQKNREFFDTGGVKRQMSNKYFLDPHFVLKPELGKTWKTWILKMLSMSTQRVPPDSELWWDLSDKSSTRMCLPGTTPSSHSQVRVWVNRSHCQGSFSEILVTKTRPLTFLTQRFMHVSTRVKLAHRFARQVTVLWVVIGCKVSLHRPTRRAFQNKLKCPFLNALSTFSTCLNCLCSYRRVLHVFCISCFSKQLVS